MPGRLRVAHFTVQATALQSARWKQAAEAEGYFSVGAWLAGAADAYLKARARAGQPLPLKWRRGTFRVRLESGEEVMVRGHVAPPFASYRGTERGPMPYAHNIHTLVYMPTLRILATLSYFRDCRALAADLARTWVREQAPAPSSS